ncbi:MAG: hypothetical protein PHX08_05130 [Lachnospiraceae bacterium]|nr:hypothetical protein [Lachnospiraceae bacterium]
MQRSMTKIDYERFNRIRRFMEEVPHENSIVPRDCRSCECYQPNWKYRTCLYSSCKYNKPIDPFRKKLLVNDVIPNPYWQIKNLYELAVGIFGW